MRPRRFAVSLAVLAVLALLGPIALAAATAQAQPRGRLGGHSSGDSGARVRGGSVESQLPARPSERIQRSYDKLDRYRASRQIPAETRLRRTDRARETRTRAQTAIRRGDTQALRRVRQRVEVDRDRERLQIETRLDEIDRMLDAPRVGKHTRRVLLEHRARLEQSRQERDELARIEELQRARVEGADVDVLGGSDGPAFAPETPGPPGERDPAN